MIWKASKTYNDIKFCKEAKTITVVDVKTKMQSLKEITHNVEFKSCCKSCKKDIRAFS